ncbi:4941_t:CDS:2 [Cetraspora pellucida]|uniref:4941_t:CDS:1 n=1 Tax=Cetraspora pellucida TaxID=1433469 RepID=A0ACA9N5T5_9GLOM|nr:4941_t:CDS:2 [Cetraspora pellucida]
MADNEIYKEDNSEVYTKDSEVYTKDSEVKNRTYNFFILSISYTFKNWDDVDFFFEVYGQQFGFAIIKKKVEHDNNIIRYRSLECEFEGKYSPKKNIDINTHRDQKSKRQGCDTKFRSIGKDVLNDIEFYTKNRNFSITVQCQLLRARYPDTVFLDSNISNAIQHFKVKSQDLESDASQLLLFLTEKDLRNQGGL